MRVIRDSHTHLVLQAKAFFKNSVKFHCSLYKNHRPQIPPQQACDSHIHMHTHIELQFVITQINYTMNYLVAIIL